MVIRATSSGPALTPLHLRGEGAPAQEQAGAPGGLPPASTDQARHMRRDHPSAILRQFGTAQAQHDAAVQVVPQQDFGWARQAAAQRLTSGAPGQPARRAPGSVHDGVALSRTKSARRLALQLIGPDGQFDLQRLEQAAGPNGDCAASQVPVDQEQAGRLRTLLSNDHALLRTICSIF